MIESAFLESIRKRDDIPDEPLEEALARPRVKPTSVLPFLEEQLGLDRIELLRYYAEDYGLQFMDLEEWKPDPALIRSIDPAVARQYFVLPVAVRSSTLVLAVSDPPDLRFVDDLEVLLDRSLEFVLVDHDRLEQAIHEHYGSDLEDIDSFIEQLHEDQSSTPVDDPEEEWRDLEQRAEEAPIIKLVNMIISDAVQQGASDIHVESLEDQLRVRFRIDGILHRAYRIPRDLQGAVTSRMKIMADLKISERRLPQDGRIKLRMLGKSLDFRVNTLPGQHGESVVLRILDQESIQFGLDQLGFQSDTLSLFEQVIRRPNGMILVTGPTGSGKTTTLYSALTKLNGPERKMITIEDPVEYQIEGINQIQVHQEIGLDFSLGLKSLLRQSPDVILVGEIRDGETAEISFRAALTGHLVFSTLHTNDAPSAIGRLMDLGVEPFLISSTIQAIMSQRLVRVICSSCKSSYEPDPDYLRQVGFPESQWKQTTFYHGEGCSRCNGTGYSGRTVISELLTRTEPLKNLVLDGRPTVEIRRRAIRDGMRTLRQDGFIEVRWGRTTLMEVARVTQAHGTVAL